MRAISPKWAACACFKCPCLEQNQVTKAQSSHSQSSHLNMALLRAATRCQCLQVWRQIGRLCSTLLHLRLEIGELVLQFLGKADEMNTELDAAEINCEILKFMIDTSSWQSCWHLSTKLTKPLWCLPSFAFAIFQTTAGPSTHPRIRS